MIGSTQISAERGTESQYQLKDVISRFRMDPEYGRSVNPGGTELLVLPPVGGSYHHHHRQSHLCGCPPGGLRAWENGTIHLSLTVDVASILHSNHRAL